MDETLICRKTNFSTCSPNTEILDMSAFEGILLILPYMPMLWSLKISESNISNISDHVFDNLTSLRITEIVHANLQIIPHHLFSYTQQMECLILHHNSLTMFHKGTFQTLNNLLVLDLSHNQLTWIQEDVFIGLDCLKVLNLQNNLIAHWQTTEKLHLPNLTILDLGDNLLKEVPHFLDNRPFYFIRYQPTVEQVTEKLGRYMHSSEVI